MKFLGIVGQTDYRSAPKNGIRLTAVIKSIPWGHNQRIMYKCNNIAEALFYAQKTMDNGWSKKIGAITHRDEPHQALNPLILSHSSMLSPASTKIPMASI